MHSHINTWFFRVTHEYRIHVTCNEASKYKYAEFKNFMHFETLWRQSLQCKEKTLWMLIYSTSFYVKMQVFNGVLTAGIHYNLH